MTAATQMLLAALETVDLLWFDLGPERFALALSSVEEVVDATRIERARNGGAAFGMLRVRDTVVPVYDATRVLRAERASPEPLAVILPSAHMFVAVLVDLAEAVPHVELEGLRTPPALISADRVMEAVLRVGARWVGLLNPAAFVEALKIDVRIAVPFEGKS